VSNFHDGPADGVTLQLRSAPLLLRVTFNPHARTYPWDALDQPEDTPKPHEQLHLYVRTGEPFFYHLSMRGKGGKAASGYWNTAEYRYAAFQPEDAIMRQPKPWQAFVIGYESETK
jgi:hypothetical protein